MKRLTWLVVPLVMALVAVNVATTAEPPPPVDVTPEAIELTVENGQLVIAEAAVEKDFVCSTLCVAWYPIKCEFELDGVCQYTVSGCECNVYNSRNR